MSHISLKGVNDLWDNTALGLKTFQQKSGMDADKFKKALNYKPLSAVIHILFLPQKAFLYVS
jgi:hypothetical protein